MKALQILAEMEIAALKVKHPGFPAHAMPATKFKDKTANELTKSICKFLDLSGCYVTRINTQGQYNQSLKRFTKSTTRLGTADIHCVVNGKHLSVEVKIRKDRMSEHQLRTKGEVEKAGGLYFVAKDFESFYQYYLHITQ